MEPQLLIPIIFAIVIGIIVYNGRKKLNREKSKHCPKCNHYPVHPRSTGLINQFGGRIYDYKCSQCSTKFR